MTNAEIGFLEFILQKPEALVGFMALIMVYMGIKLIAKGSNRKDDLLMTLVTSMLQNGSNDSDKGIKDWLRSVEADVDRTRDEVSRLNAEIHSIKPILEQVRKKVLNGHTKH